MNTKPIETQETLRNEIESASEGVPIEQDGIELTVEELEEVIAPRIAFNHNETLV
jgi:hypothetical protein